MDKQDETNNKNNGIHRLESSNDDILKNSTKNTGFGLAMWLSGWILGTYVFNSLAFGIGLGLLYWLSFAYVRIKKK